MCFGGGGGQQQQAPAPINIMPQAPVIKQPEPPKQLTETYKTLQPQTYQPGVQQAGAGARRRDLATGGRESMARRRGLSLGISGSPATPPSGGINL